MKFVSLLAVESSEWLVEGLRRIVARSRFRIVHHYKSIEDLREADPPDEDIGAILIDASDSLGATEADIANLRRTFRGAKIILMSDAADCPKVMRACENIDGIVLKSSEGAVLVKALELILLGERMFPVAAWQGVRATQPEPPCADSDDGADGAPLALENLSDREIEVLKLLYNASPNKVIARELGIAEATVKVHVKAILRKTNTKNRTEAALLMSSLQQRGVGDH